MARASIIALALAAFACASSVSAQTATDVLIANFALNLEYLEANFYSCAAYGRILQLRSLIGSKGKKATGCPKNAHRSLSREGRAYAISIAIDEIAHVAFLRAALGAAAVDQPRLDIGPALTAAASVASGGLITNFAPYGSPALGTAVSDLFFYHAAFVFEDVGVTAYKGAAKFISNKGILDAAAGILAVEAYHGGAIRAILVEADYALNKPVVKGLTVEQIIGAIAALRGKLGGGKDAGLFKRARGNGGGRLTVPVLAPADSNAIAYSRTPKEVLSIVTFGSKSGKGGFYPEGLNGNFAPLLKI